MQKAIDYLRDSDIILYVTYRKEETMYVLFCYGVYGYYETHEEALAMYKILEKKGYREVLSIEKMED